MYKSLQNEFEILFMLNKKLVQWKVIYLLNFRIFETILLNCTYEYFYYVDNIYLKYVHL